MTLDNSEVLWSLTHRQRAQAPVLAGATALTVGATRTVVSLRLSPSHSHATLAVVAFRQYPKVDYDIYKLQLSARPCPTTPFAISLPRIPALSSLEPHRMFVNTRSAASMAECRARGRPIGSKAVPAAARAALLSRGRSAAAAAAAARASAAPAACPCCTGAAAACTCSCHGAAAAGAAPARRAARGRVVAAAAGSSAGPVKPTAALIFDCDGVIVETEELHRCVSMMYSCSAADTVVVDGSAVAIATRMR
jgi:hypothetical protein